MHTKSNFNRLSKKNLFEKKIVLLAKMSLLGHIFAGRIWVTGGVSLEFFREVILMTIEGGRIQEGESFHKICNLCVFKN